MSISYCLVLLASLIICTTSSTTNKPANSSLTTRKISLGSLIGKRHVSARGTVAYLYLGVPFAEPPIGALRYRRPVAKKSWRGVYNATEYKLNTFDDVSQSEDCLQLNIYASEHCLQSRAACAVIYYVFGGAFVFNSAINLPIDDLVDNFVSRNVILVTTNYRLAALGWFNSGQKSSAVKNAALWDMIEGLRWVQREIGVFGGDRDRVTLMGHSSGSLNCDELAISPLTKGLFSQTILLSGPAGFVNTAEGHNYNASRLLAIEAGCATEDSWLNAIEDVLNCLRTKNASTLIDAQIASQTTLGLKFDGPTIDANEGDQALIPLPILQLQAKRAGIRLLVGGTNKEFQETKLVIKKGKKGDADTVTLPLLYYYCASLPEYRQFTQKWAIARACVDEYRTPERAIDLSDDIKMYVPMIDSAANTVANGGSAYLYSFEYEYIGDAIAATGPLKKTPENTPKHVDDVVYLIGLRKGKFTPKDVEIQRIYSGLFADFANYGDPSPVNQTWNKFDSEKNNYFLIDFNRDLKMPGNQLGFHQRGFNFWTKTAVEIEEKQSKDKNDKKEHKKFFAEFLTSLVDLSKKGQHSASVANTLRTEAHRLSQLLESNDMTMREKPMLASLMRVASLLMAADDVDHETFEPERIDSNHRRQQLAQAMLPATQLASLPAIANSSSFFWIAIVVIVALVLTLAVTCTLLCRNYTKRRQYERFV